MSDDQPRRLTDEELIRRLERMPYSRTCREAAQRLRELAGIPVKSPGRCTRSR